MESNESPGMSMREEIAQPCRVPATGTTPPTGTPAVEEAYSEIVGFSLTEHEDSDALREHPEIRQTIRRVQTLMQALGELAGAVVDTSDEARGSTEVPGTASPVSATIPVVHEALAVPLTAQIRTLAQIFADARHRHAYHRVAWAQMEKAERDEIAAGIRGLIEEGYCVVPQEMVSSYRALSRHLRGEDSTR